MMLLSLTLLLALLAGCATSSSAPPDSGATRHRADAAFHKLSQGDGHRTPPDMAAEGQAMPVVPGLVGEAPPPRESSLRATGYGDLKRGALVCQRVADAAARAELAKLIRVHVQEQITDRVRERTGRPLEQEIEVVREERVGELLRDVTITDRREDPAAGTCASTAVMPIRRATPQTP